MPKLKTRSVFHSMPKRLKFELVVLAVLAVFGAGYFYMPDRFDENRGISEENLQKFYELTKSDGLFYDPNLDTKLLKEAVSDLKNTEARVLAANRPFQSKGDKEILSKDWHLWPVDFLNH